MLGAWGLQSVRNCSFLLLLPPRTSLCSGLGSSHGLLRINLFQHGLLSCQLFLPAEPAPAWRLQVPSGNIHLLHCGILHGLQHGYWLPWGLSRGCREIPVPPSSLQGLQGNLCSPVRSISSPPPSDCNLQGCSSHLFVSPLLALCALS